MLDYDGTLTAFKNHPEDAVPTPALRDLLQRFCSDPRNHVTINSGRDHYTLEKWLGDLPLSFAAEHGAFYKEKGAWHKNIGNREWDSELLFILNLFVSKTPYSHLETKEAALAWHYRESDAWLGELRAQQLTKAIMPVCLKKGLQIMQGNKVVEIKSPECTKGSEVDRLLLASRYDFILAMGDDTTDEDMFRALPVSAITVKVGIVSEKAKYNLSSQEEVLPFLEKLSGEGVSYGTTSRSIKGQLKATVDFFKGLWTNKK